MQPTHPHTRAQPHVAGTIDRHDATRSIYAYFGAERIVTSARYGRCRLVRKPIDLSRVVLAGGSLAFEQPPPGHNNPFFGREIERWSEFLGTPVLTDPAHHFGDRTGRRVLFSPRSRRAPM